MLLCPLRGRSSWVQPTRPPLLLWVSVRAKTRQWMSSWHGNTFPALWTRTKSMSVTNNHLAHTHNKLTLSHSVTVRICASLSSVWESHTCHIPHCVSFRPPLFYMDTVDGVALSSVPLVCISCHHCLHSLSPHTGRSTDGSGRGHHVCLPE